MTQIMHGRLNRTHATLLRLAASVSVLGAAILAGPLTAAAEPPQTQHHHHHVAAEMKRETVEERIATLHKEFEITPSEESSWSNVAQVMRDNDATMQKLIAERGAQIKSGLNALDDLKEYEKFAHAHVDGLRNLITSFEILYTSMPPAQKILADHVFQARLKESAAR